MELQGCIQDKEKIIKELEDELKNSNTKNKIALINLQTIINQKDGTINSLKIEKFGIQEQNEELRTKISDLNKELLAIQSTKDDKEKTIRDCRFEISNLKLEIEELDKKIKNEKSKLESEFRINEDVLNKKIKISKRRNININKRLNQKIKELDNYKNIFSKQKEKIKELNIKITSNQHVIDPLARVKNVRFDLDIPKEKHSSKLCPISNCDGKGNIRTGGARHYSIDSCPNNKNSNKNTDNQTEQSHHNLFYNEVD